MNYAAAMKLVAKSKPVRRPLWDSCLIPHPKTKGVAMWDLPAELRDEYKDRRYEPHETDVRAQDWQRA